MIEHGKSSPGLGSLLELAFLWIDILGCNLKFLPCQ
jgi:hypothetical protein